MICEKKAAAPGRTPGTPDCCEYAFCKEPGAGEARYRNLAERGGIPWTMCAGHVKPGHHPAEARDKLAAWAA